MSKPEGGSKAPSPTTALVPQPDKASNISRRAPRVFFGRGEMAGRKMPAGTPFEAQGKPVLPSVRANRADSKNIRFRAIRIERDPLFSVT